MKVNRRELLKNAAFASGGAWFGFPVKVQHHGSALFATILADVP